MASIYLRPNTKCWQCAYYVTDPVTGMSRQVRKSTGQTDRNKAQKAACDMEAAARRAAGADDDSTRAILGILERAARDAAKGKLNVATGRALLSELVELAAGEGLQSYSILGWLNEWLERKRKTTSPASMLRYESSVKSFADWLGKERSAKPLESLTVADVRKFRDQLKAGGRTAKTVNKYSADIASALRVAVKEGLIVHNVAAAVDPLPVDRHERQPFTAKEVGALLRHASSEDWRGLILIGVFTGLRLGDARGLRWADIDLENGVLHCTPSKTKRKGTKVVIPIHPDLGGFLRSKAGGREPAEPVLPTLVDIKLGGKDGLSELFVGIMDAAGVGRGESREADGEAGRTRHSKSFHSLRHTFTSMMLNAGVSPELRMKMTGHTDTNTHAAYSHAEVEILAGAIGKLPNLMPDAGAGARKRVKRQSV